MGTDRMTLILLDDHLLPYDFQNSICYDEHFTGNFSSSTNHVAWCEDGSTHLEHQIVQKLGLAFFKNAHLARNQEREGK